MNVSPPESVPAELGALFNRAVLHLSPDVRKKTLSKERVALKHQPGRSYFMVTPQRWALLEKFKDGRTVTAVLCDLIASRHCPALRELYELVAKATRAGSSRRRSIPCPLRKPP